MSSVITFNGPNSPIVPGMNGAVLLAAVAALWAAPVLADPVADFYRGKSITVVSAGEAGGVHSTCSFVAEAAMRGLAIHPVPWQLQQDLAAQILATPDATVSRLRRILGLE